ncbi:PIN domain-containing protein [uncultured Nocardioides sp.]|uniref:PIN domain-containing protein n=1 Tax=uncultured Nocardioides sp. TaxID=198441 RepID=UPI002610111D|nr:PIN domain-containing protein [uncultured Nocardioides sp.]
MTVFHLDSSVALRALLGHSRSAALWIDEVSADDRHELTSSRLLRTELTRVLRREGLPVSLRDEVLDVVSLVPLTESTLAAAEAIEPHVKTLDALHLGSIIARGGDVTVVTHDDGMKSAAARLGYDCLDPVDAD